MKRTLVHLLVLLFALIGASCKSPTIPDGDDVTNLEKNDVVVGTGAEAVLNRYITVYYTGYLYEEEIPDHRGAPFDGNVGGTPIEFLLGGTLIAGWNQGIPGMRVGGTRTLIIPSRLGYGEKGNPPSIPPNSALVFDIQLLAVR